MYIRRTKDYCNEYTRHVRLIAVMPFSHRIATYSRVSTAHHDQNPEIQVQELRRFCKARGWEIAHEIIDHGYSGSSDNRPGLRQLLTLVRSRQVDMVVVLKLDRLFRSLKHLVMTLEDFEALGVQFVAVRDNVDYSTAAGRLFVQVLGCLGEFEKALVRERTLLGLAHARAQGKRLGRPRIGKEREIRALRTQGLSYRQIEARLGVSRGTVHRALRSVPKTPSLSFQNLCVKTRGARKRSG
jgi:DNA invertase Pin-like site-specific DNA recombinase